MQRDSNLHELDPGCMALCLSQQLDPLDTIFGGDLVASALLYRTDSHYKPLAESHTHHRSANHHLRIMSSFGLLHTVDSSRTANVWCLCGLILSYQVLSFLEYQTPVRLILQYIFPQVVCLVGQGFPPQLHVPWEILLKHQGNKCMNGTKPTKKQSQVSGFSNVPRMNKFSATRVRLFLTSFG